MASTQSPVTAPTATLSSEVTAVTSWFKVHEKLIIIFMCLVFLFFVLDKSLGIVSQWEQHRASQAQSVLDTQKAKTDAEIAQAKALLVSYQDQIALASKEIASLTASQASRDKVVVVQQKADAAMPPSQLATRWQGLVGDSGVQLTPSGFNVLDTAALATVSNLEQVPVLKADLSDEQEKTAALQKDVTDADALIGQGKLAGQALQLQLADKDKQCATEVSAVKADARKGKLKWFGIGYALGFVSGVVLIFH